MSGKSTVPTVKAMKVSRDRERDFSKKKQELEEKTQEAAIASGNAAARMTAYISQVGEIEAAEGRARAKGISTTGKVVGTQTLASSALSGVGSTVADIGIDENIEADELDPNMVRSGLDIPDISMEMTQAEQAMDPAMTPEEREQEWERYHSMDYDLEL